MNDCKLRRRFGRFMSLFLVFCLLLGLAGCGGSETEKEKTVIGKTPEKTLETFFEALSEQDVETMMACCYIDDYMERVSFAQFIDRVQAYFPTNGISAPTEYDYYRELVGYELRNNYARAFKMLAFSLLATGEEYEDLLNNLAIPNIDRRWAKKFSREVDPELLSNLKILSIDEDCPDQQNDPRIKENYLKNSQADDWVERTVLLELDGNLFYKGFILVEIDGRWQIHMLGGLFIEDSTMGAATPIESKAAYRELIQ